MLRTTIYSIQNFQGIPTKPYLELKLKMLNDSWISFTHNHEELVGNATDEEMYHEYFVRKIYQHLQQDYEYTVIYVQELLESIVTSQKQECNKNTIKLPRIEIPHFYGDYKQWLSFYSLFNKTINCNEKLTNEEKMYYLLSATKGEAGKLISHLNISEANYNTAWNILISRYDDKRYLTNTYINMITDLPNLSVESANALRTMHDITMESLHAIKNLGVNTEHWDAIITNILIKKLDNETHRLYETSLKNPKEVQTIKSFLEFLQVRFQSLGSIARDKPYQKKVIAQQPTFNKTSTHVAVTKKQERCTYCCSEHKLTECKNFQQLSSFERIKALSAKPLCRKCLLSSSPEHKSQCSKTCDLCKGFHHSLLHNNEKPSTQKAEMQIKTVLQTAQLLQVEKRLAKNPQLAPQYTHFMNEYLQLGHMKEIKSADETIDNYYFPHHPVLKEESTTTKLRVVFDGSAKTSTGTSLNNIMLTGPTLQQDLLSILLRWRKHKYVYTVDVEKMFRQVHEYDQKYQRILWRNSPQQQVKEYKLTTVTYVTAAATYLAVKTLQQLANDERPNYQKAAEVVINDFYVDDLISGNNTLEEALALQGDISDLLSKGGFLLRKWATNNIVLLQSIPVHLRAEGKLEFKLDDTIKTLGLHWNPTSDTFGFNVSQPTSSKSAKRNLLSESAKLFDPLGWLAPFTVVAKLMMQELWLAGLRWDEVFPPVLSAQGQDFKNSLPLLQVIAIPRWINFENNISIELYGFCDASEKAYAAVVYAKHHLKRVIGETTLTYEELSTVTSQIEACLNSRPLTRISSDPNELILTPGHFLVGDSLVMPPEEELLNENIPLGRRWKLVQRMVQDFWKHWSNNYITSLQQRTKWTSRHAEPKIDDIVLIKDNNLSPARWPLARITELHPGKDNLTRVVTIQGSNGSTFKRPITKISVLPLEHDQPEQHKHVTNDGNKPTSTVTNLNVLPVLLLSLVAITTVFYPANATNQSLYNMTKFTHQPGIYFEYSGNIRFTSHQWKAIVYFNLTSYYAEIGALRNWARNLDQLCQATPEENHQICSAINSQIMHILIDIENKNEILHYSDKKKRTKRGIINIVGNLASDLFGVLDDRDAKHYEEEIEKLKTNQEHLLIIVKNQTSISDATLNILKRTEADITSHWQILQHQITSQLDDISNMQRLLSLSVHTLLLMLDFKETQQKLIEAALNTHNKAISTLILPPHQLNDALRDIIHHIPPDATLPGINGNYELLSLYQIMSCQSKISGQYLIFELKIPILNQVKYQIFKPLPLPTTEGVFIKPAMEILVTSLHRDEYYIMTEYEFQHCKHSNGEYICIILHPIHLAHNNNSICELNLLTSKEPVNCQIVKQTSTNPKDTWIKLKNNKWIFSVRQERQAHIVCGEDMVVAQLSNSGIITLNGGCTLKEGSLILKTLKTIETRFDSSYLPASNLSANWIKGAMNHSLELAGPPTVINISQLQERIMKQMEEEQLSISHHDIHQYSVLYGLIALCVTGICIYIFKYKRRSPSREDYNLNTSGPGEC